MKAEDLRPELRVTTSRSSGPGGQNVNKVESRICLHWSPSQSQLLTALQAERILEVLGNKLDSRGYLQVCAQEKRSQLDNRHLAETKLLKLIHEALVPQTPRLATKVSRAQKAKRAKEKKAQSQKKQDRRFRP